MPGQCCPAMGQLQMFAEQLFIFTIPSDTYCQEIPKLIPILYTILVQNDSPGKYLAQSTNNLLLSSHDPLPQTHGPLILHDKRCQKCYMKGFFSKAVPGAVKIIGSLNSTKPFKTEFHKCVQHTWAFCHDTAVTVLSRLSDNLSHSTGLIVTTPASNVSCYLVIIICTNRVFLRRNI